ncbi:DUF4124 domain-containing protein [Oceanicoccus sagamiensis]|uniref:DUF4124 domain-containing protein n=1 Tax=Oceanicoccus sagamiensis TaxID=716816 RepID=A0A1X9N650_9GAMM|nr:DUF4124 domain-containing protein [Oceanicoccus sagamiensis]ARN73580.1 hypothetical protein BST96_05270 [Oceanicoccus sagamiensis]
MNSNRLGNNTGLLALTFSLCLLFIGLNTSAQVYKSVDKDGNVSYSDQPAPDAKPVEIQETNSAKSVEVPIAVEPLPTALAPNSYDMLRINSPANDGIIANGLVPFTVTTSVKPQLKKGHKLQLSIDGVAQDTGQGNFTVNSISRGEHRLQVAIIDANGTILKQSANVKVFAYRPSTAGSTYNSNDNGGNRPKPEHPIAKPPVTIQPIPGPGRPNLGGGGGGRGR